MGRKEAVMCLHEDSPVPMTQLPRVRVEMLLTDLNAMYVKVGLAKRVLIEGDPDKKDRLLRELLTEVGRQMDEASGGFLAARNV